jgi:hypothetical protein
MDASGRDALVEAALTAWRPRTTDGRIHPHPAWADLPADDRGVVFEATLQARSLESLADPEGLSTTARTVLRRILRAP